MIKLKKIILKSKKRRNEVWSTKKTAVYSCDEKNEM